MPELTQREEVTASLDGPAAPESEGPRVVPWSEQDGKAIRAKIKDELAGRSLAGWESDFCRWLALQDKKVGEKDQLAVATALANRRVMRKELQALKRRGPYIRLFAKEQGSLADKEIERARTIAARVMPKGMELAEQMVDASMDAITERDAKVAQKMDVVRAASPLVNQLLERVVPKKQEGGGPAPVITIHLSTHQTARLDEPSLASEAVDVPFEIVAQEQLPATGTGG